MRHYRYCCDGTVQGGAGLTWTVAAMPGGAILVQCRVPAGQKQAKVMPLMDSTARTHHRDPHRCMVEYAA